ncbi:hypothetical protein PHISCL_03334 [Aspergillus sclerotialis]|uniref:Uncharacterized protein n=1 Tax=Aspergillus sclerotialis TaxID=2070753 RepID=A0A3A2ZM80_9EURO|nr:hypothetical protein PHISCL_03334 [Aspergillus sclerotialis]
MSYPMPNLHFRDSWIHLQGALSRSVARSSRHIGQKVRNTIDVALFANERGFQHPVSPPHVFPRLNATYCLMDVDYLRPPGLRPWGPPYSLRVMNPDPDYLDEEYVQVGPSPSEFDVFQLSSSEDGKSESVSNTADVDEKPDLPHALELPEIPDDQSSSDESESNSEDTFWKEVKLFIDEKNKYNLPSDRGTNWEELSRLPLLDPPETLHSYRECHPNKELTLCDETADSEDAAILAGVIRAGLLTQRSRSRMLL